jgi:phage protein D
MAASDLVVTSRPTLKIDGRDAAGPTQGLLTMRVHEHADGMYAAELQFGNWGLSGNGIDFIFFDRQTIDFGKEIEITVQGAQLFKGRITALEAGFPEAAAPVLTVLAEDRLQDLRMTRRTRTFADMSDADVMSQIASDHGLSPSVNAPGPTHDVLAQVAQSDLAFLRARARAVGAEVWVDGTTLNVAPRASRSGGAPITLGYGNELREFTVLADLAGQRSSVAVSGWDVAGKTAINETADDGDLGGEASSGESGPSILASALAQRKDSVVTSAPVTTEEAQAHAKAIFLRGARRFVTGHGLASTAPGLRVGATVNVQGTGPLFSGEYYVSEVRHVFDTVMGMRTELEVERPWLGRPQS